MKQYLLGIAALLMGTALMTGCSDSDNDNDEPQTSLQAYSKGAYVVNYGDWGLFDEKADASLTAIDFESGQATQNVYKTANGNEALGIGANDGLIYGDKMYIVCRLDNSIEVLDKNTKKSINKINTVKMLHLRYGEIPEHLISHDGKIFFTTSVGGVASVDTTSFALVDKYQLDGSCDGLVMGGDYLYVACQSSFLMKKSSISRINLKDGNIETKTIEGMHEPSEIYYTAGQLYVQDFNSGINDDGELYKQETLLQVDFEKGTSQKVADCNSATLAAAGAGTRMSQQQPYFLILYTPDEGTPSVSVYHPGDAQVQELAVDELPLNPHHIYADPLTGHFFLLSDSNTDSSKGRGQVMEYDATGKKLHEYDAGANPTAMFFETGYREVNK